MSLVEINWNPQKKDLRKFGLIALVILGIASIFLHFAFKISISHSLIPATAGFCIFLISLASTKAVKIIYIGMTLAALPIGFTVSILLMGIFYFLILTPIAISFKIFGRDQLNRRFLPDSESYWSARQNSTDKQRYFHQS